MPIKLNSTGGGSITIDVPNMSTANTLILPGISGNVITSADSGTITQAMFGTRLAGNGPAFAAYPSASQSFTTGTETKVQYNIKVFDTATCYDTSAYRFTPNRAGYYYMSAVIGFNLSSSTSGIKLYKNGSPSTGTAINFGQVVNNTGIVSICASGLVYLNGSTDYVEVYARQDTGSTNSNYSLQGLTQFTGMMVRSA